MKESEGERMVRAIQKLAEKVSLLENERRMSKRNVETMDHKKIRRNEASELFQRLAKAEARCKALQQQLSHIRRLVKDTSFKNLDDSIQDSKISFQEFSKLADKTNSFETLPSLTSLLMDNARTSNLFTQGLKLDRFEPDENTLVTSHISTDNLSKGFSSEFLDVPVDEHFTTSGSRHWRSQRRAKKMEATSVPGLENFIDTGLETKTQCIQETPQNNESHSSFHFRNTEQIETVIPGEMQKKSQRQRPSSQARSGERSPIGMFLQPSSNKTDVKSHFHVKMNEIPFCSATTAGKTHSLGANLQNLMSMVKVCHPALCSAAPLHRRRSRSVDRKTCSRFADHHSSQKGKLPRWNSTSSLDGTICKPTCHMPATARRGRSRSLERTTCSGLTSNSLGDLDLVPVKLKSSQSPKNLCETPGNVCIKTEIKPLPAGSNKIVEVKMTTRAKVKGEKSHRNDFDTNRRQLLKNVQELQFMVEKDQCC